MRPWPMGPYYVNILWCSFIMIVYYFSIIWLFNDITISLYCCRLGTTSYHHVTMRLDAYVIEWSRHDIVFLFFLCSSMFIVDFLIHIHVVISLSVILSSYYTFKLAYNCAVRILDYMITLHGCLIIALYGYIIRSCIICLNDYTIRSLYEYINVFFK